MPFGILSKSGTTQELSSDYLTPTPDMIDFSIHRQINHKRY